MPLLTVDLATSMHFAFINININNNTEIIHMPDNALIDELKKIDVQLQHHQQIVKRDRRNFDLKIFTENLKALERLFNAAKQNHRIFDERTGTPAFVAGLMHKLGFLAKNVNRGQSQRLLSIEHGLWLLNLLIGDGRAKPHHLSMALYGLGQLAKAGILYGTMGAEVLQTCLTKLKDLPNLNTQHISNSLYGLGQLAAAGCFEGRLEAQVLQTCLTKLVSLPSLKTQEISNSLYGLGQLAAVGCLHGRLEAQVLQACLTKLANLSDLDTQGLSNSLYGLGQLAAAGCLEGRLEAQVLQACLTKLANLSDLDTQGLSNSLYGLGQLAVAGCFEGRLEAQVLQACLTKLANLSDLDAQGLSNSLYGLGQLATAGCLRGRLEAQVLQACLTKLANLSDLSTQGISNSLYGLGQLAAAGGLEGRLDAQVLQTCLPKLASLSNFKTQHISNSLYGLGQLAAAGCLHGRLEARVLQACLTELASLPNLNTQEISNSLYGLGQLAATGCLHGRLEAQVLQACLTKLASLPNFNTQDISNSLYGLGQLAAAGCLHGRLDAQVLQTCLPKLASLSNFKTQHISNGLYGLGQLAAVGCLHGRLDTQLLQACLTKLKDLPNLEAQHISNSLYGLGQLAAAGCLEGHLDARVLQACLAKLKDLPDLEIQHISNSLYGLKQLMVRHRLTGADGHPLPIIPLLKPLIEAVKDRSARVWVARDAFLLMASIHALAPLATDIATDHHVLAELATLALSGNYLHPSEAVQLVHAFVDVGLMGEPFDALFARALSAIQVPFNRLAPRFQDQMREDLKKLQDGSTWHVLLQAKISGPVARLDLGNVPRHTEEDVDPWVTGLTQEAPRLADGPSTSSLSLLPSVSSASPFSTARTSVARTAGPPQPRKASDKARGSSGPSSLGLEPEVKREAMKNAVFVAIYERDESQLRQLLGLAPTTTSIIAPRLGKRSRDEADGVGQPRKRGPGSLPDSIAAPRLGKRSRDEPDGVGQPRKRGPGSLSDDNAMPQLACNTHRPDKIVSAFLSYTSAEAFIALAKKREVSYFNLLIEACSPHQRYQLAINRQMHLLLLHLPLAALEAFIAHIIYPCHLYVDHKALLALLDAVTIRHMSTADQAEQITVVALQRKLLSEGLRHHERHHHVLPRLRVAECNISSVENTLDYEDVDERIRSQQARMASTPIKPEPSSSLSPKYNTDRGGSSRVSVSTRASLFGANRGTSSSSNSRFSRDGESATLGDGNCLYNGIAKGIKQNRGLQIELERVLTKVGRWDRFVRHNPGSDLAIQGIASVEPQEKSRILATFLRETFNSADDILVQKRLAPILHFITVNYLKYHFGQKDIPLFPQSMLSELAIQYLNNHAFRDETHLLYHGFIREKLDGLIAADSTHAPLFFARWFEDEGKNCYLNEIQKPAAHADDRARWGSEIEMNALAMLLRTTFVWEKNDVSDSVGVLSGIVRVSKIGDNLAATLIRLGIADSMRLRSHDKTACDYLRFKVGSQAQLELHTGPLLLNDFESCEASVRYIMAQWQYARQRTPLLTVYDFMSQEDYLNQPVLAQQYLARGILTPEERALTQSDGSFDEERMALLAQGLDVADVARIRSFLGRPQTSMTLRFEGLHWSYVSPEPAIPTSDLALASWRP